MESLPGYDAWLESPYQRRCAEEDEMNRQIEEYDNFDGWMQWLENERIGNDFETYCYDHFWNMLRKDFQAQLHPDTIKQMEMDDPLMDIWPYWSMYLFLVLDRKRLEILVGAFVESNRDAFEDWVLA